MGAVEKGTHRRHLRTGLSMDWAVAHENELIIHDFESNIKTLWDCPKW